ncbi:site-specific integrase [Bacillaceae bacterium SIJ1]|uniref:tyrosine-type recombinase/integrase n=1 Tax=Litoribacterium kuwaitense TaxID=1398745 RepID=UPI0013EA4BC2|nr:site-specific integrase [Litoribacterium kuwaitense]NGP44982.1 site-specific integrase [Litoribacterium kuwaitense]
MGYIEKRGKGKFRLNVVTGYTAEGAPIRERKTVEAKNKTEAKPLLAEFELEVLGGDYIKPNNKTLDQHFEDWLDLMESRMQPRTFGEYTNIYLKRIKPMYGHFKVVDIRPMHIEKYLKYLQQDDNVRLDGKTGSLSSSTISNSYKAFANILERAVEWKLIKSNPSENIKPPRVEHKKSDVYTPDEMAQIFELLESESFSWRVMVYLAFTSGAREGEIAGLEAKHLNEEKNTIYIEQAITNKKGVGAVLKGVKNDQVRHVSIPKEVMKMLLKLSHIRKQEKFGAGSRWEYPDNLFLWGDPETGRPIRTDSISQWWRRFTNRHNFKHIRFHSLRHASATHLINQGEHAKVIQERLGHTRMDTTMRIYSHLLAEADERASSHFDSFVQKKKSK